MTTEKRNNCLTAGILGALAAFGGIGCMVTGLHIDQISMAAVASVCILAAAACAATAGRRLFPIVPALLTVICLGSWLKGTLELSAEALLNHISYLYDLGYGWGVIRWSNEHLSVDMAQQALCILGALTAMGVSWSFLRCRSVWLAAALVSIPVVPCMILADTVPSAPYLFLSLLCLALLLLTRLARKEGHGNALLKMLALPAAAALLILFTSLPREEYTCLQRLDAIIGHVQEYFTDSSKEGPNIPVQQESGWVDLAAVGPKQDQKTAVMEVFAQQSGYLYLKGAAYDTYRGTWWDSKDTGAAPVSSSGNIYAFITTKAIHDVLYLPYGAGSIHPETDLTEENGRVKNPDYLRTYTVYYSPLPAYTESWQKAAEDVPQQLTQLPNDTLEAARQYLARELPELDTVSGVWSKAKAIAEHVSRSARYSLQTAQMPQISNDFALWFLEESETGYCIHFASATTVLLRAAGIPARYVTGYLVSANPTVTTKVTKGDAHAWAECYVDGVGWVPLEATPGYSVSQEAGSETTAPTEDPSATQDTAAQNTETQETLGQQPTGPQTDSTAPELPTDQPSQNTSPVGGIDGPEPPQSQTAFLWMKWALGILFAAGIVTGQWRLRVCLRQKKRHRGKRSAQALARWREVVLHCRVRRITPDARLHALAQKARFSHHAVTREELMEFNAWLNRSKEAIRQLSLLKRFLATVLFALY